MTVLKTIYNNPANPQFGYNLGKDKKGIRKNLNGLMVVTWN
jgi:hypothetical protein